jgi:hypothetical protein
VKNLKKHHHYVWKEYLKPWTTENKIYCKRKGKTFLTSLNNVGQERFFYKSIKLGTEEIKFIKFIINGLKPDKAESINLIYNLYTYISNSNDEYLVKCGIEDIHMHIENFGSNCLKKLQKGNIEFLKRKEYRYQLSRFLGVQYTRTKNMRSKMMPSMLENKKLDLEKMALILQLIYGEIIANWIYNNGNIISLKNNTSLNFITSDQPIFNTKSKQTNTEYVEEFKLYYPVTPNYAIFISKENEKFKINNLNDVRFYNKLVERNSHEQIYGKKIEDIE